MADGNWHHIAFAVDGLIDKLYADGALKTSQVWTGSPGAPSTTRPLLIGRYDTFTPMFNGLIDEPAIYSRALVAAEIQSIVAAGGHGICAPSSLSITSAGTNYQLHVAGTATETYQLQTAPVVTGPWTNLGPPRLANPAGRADFIDATTSTQRFFRATVTEP